MKDVKQRFESEENDVHILHEYDTEEDDISDVLERFKYFLLAKSYPSSMVERIVYLSEDQYAKSKLLEE